MMELIGELMSQLGVQEEQAKGGAGLIFKLAKEKLGSDFSQVEAAVPDAEDLFSSAPQSSGMGKLAGGLLGAIGGSKAQGLSGLAGLVGGFSKLDLDSGMVAKFVPIVLNFAKQKGGQNLTALLEKGLLESD